MMNTMASTGASCGVSACNLIVTNSLGSTIVVTTPSPV